MSDIIDSLQNCLYDFVKRTGRQPLEITLDPDTFYAMMTERKVLAMNSDWATWVELYGPKGPVKIKLETQKETA